METRAERRKVSGILLVSGAPRRTAQACKANVAARVVRPAALRCCKRRYQLPPTHEHTPGLTLKSKSILPSSILGALSDQASLFISPTAPQNPFFGGSTLRFSLPTPSAWNLVLLAQLPNHAWTNATATQLTPRTLTGLATRASRRDEGEVMRVLGVVEEEAAETREKRMAASWRGTWER